MTAPAAVPQIIASSAGRAWRAIEADLIHVPRGRSSAPGSDLHLVGMHFGPPVNADCSVDGRRSRRVQKPGDIDFVPAGAEGTWEDDADCRILRLRVPPSLVQDVAYELGKDLARLDLAPRLQMRDVRIEAIGWAIKADLEAEAPSDPLYIDMLANALAVRLIELAGDARQPPAIKDRNGMSAGQLAMLVEFIETNLDQRLNLADLARVAGISPTRFKTLFRNSTGTPVHQYVMRRRVEYARALITTTTMRPSEIAIAAGFSHQSHMASTMRRVLGLTPREIDRPPRTAGPILL